jgi:excisionase family DNA binding protein
MLSQSRAYDSGLPPELCSVRTAACALGLSSRTIWRWIRQGKLRAWGRRGAIRVLLAEVLPAYTSKSLKGREYGAHALPAISLALPKIQGHTTKRSKDE